MKKCKVNDDTCSKKNKRIIKSKIGFLCNAHWLKWSRHGDPHYTKRHNYSHHPWYNTWNSIMSRCYKSHNPKYHRYGGRGIKVYKKWHNLKEFCDYMLDKFGKPIKGLSIDRINNDWHYYPTNVKLSDAIEQANNTSNNTKIICNETGEVFASQSEAARQMALHQPLIWRVLNGKQATHLGYTFSYVE